MNNFSLTSSSLKMILSKEQQFLIITIFSVFVFSQLISYFYNRFIKNETFLEQDLAHMSAFTIFLVLVSYNALKYKNIEINSYFWISIIGVSLFVYILEYLIGYSTNYDTPLNYFSIYRKHKKRILQKNSNYSLSNPFIDKLFGSYQDYHHDGLNKMSITKRDIKLEKIPYNYL